ncbi:MAG: hypothetical protein M3Q27_07835 [Actinomycetota bacterium]|nr:hypothetical protein [Actinomycetota bacterium]
MPGNDSDAPPPGPPGQFDVRFSRTSDKAKAAFVVDGVAHYGEQTAPGGSWPQPEPISGGFYAPGGSRVRLAAGGNGWRAVGYNELETCWLRVRRPDGTWADPTEPAHGCHLTDVLINGKGVIHLLVNTGQGLTYQTNASGEWRVQRLGDWAIDSMLTRDPQTGRLVAVVSDNNAIGAAGTVQVAGKPRTWKRFGALHVVARRALATSVSIFGGTITVAAERESAGSAATGAFVATGPRADKMSTLARIPGTTDDDRRPRVSAGCPSPATSLVLVLFLGPACFDVAVAGTTLERHVPVPVRVLEDLHQNVERRPGPVRDVREPPFAGSGAVVPVPSPDALVLRVEAAA